VKRVAIVTLDKVATPKKKIEELIDCSRPTVNKWIKHFGTHFNVDDQKQKSGRNRTLSSEVVNEIVTNSEATGVDLMKMAYSVG